MTEDLLFFVFQSVSPANTANMGIMNAPPMQYAILSPVHLRSKLILSSRLFLREDSEYFFPQKYSYISCIPHPSYKLSKPNLLVPEEH
jgi:hypothetical protein